MPAVVSPVLSGVLSAPPALAPRFLEPEGLIWGRFTGAGGTSLRWCRLTVPYARAHCVVVGGFSEFIEKYFETVRDLAARGITVWCLDWRGQGGSERGDDPLASRPGLREFDTDIDDLSHFAEAAFTQSPPAPRLLVAHSMGAAIGLLALARNPALVDAAVLSAPMLGIETKPFPRLGARLLAAIATFLGFEKHFVPGAGPWRFNADLSPAKSHVSHCPDRCQIHQRWYQAQPRLRVDGPTYGWLHSAFRLTKRFRAKGLLESITTPILLGSAAKERFVKPKSHVRAAARLPNCRLVKFPDAKHELFMECDDIRARWFTEIDAFIAAHLIKPP